MFTATFGGLVRDLLRGRPPRILYSTVEVYALPALCGGLSTTLVLRTATAAGTEAVLTGALVTCIARILAINHDLKLPTFPADMMYSMKARPLHIAEKIAWQEGLTPYDREAGAGMEVDPEASYTLQDVSRSQPQGEGGSIGTEESTTQSATHDLASRVQQTSF
mmetsp:Transcript_41167/g.96194  ORF Transcript_41167/g.96194 Transcript_41167/m.96194 type:complete len:164 (+) Transcript_41167:410-901(+)